MIHAQQIEEEKLKERSREAKRVKTSDGDFSHSRSDGHGHYMFRQRFSDQGSSNALVPKFNNDKHEGKCLASTYGCFGCGMSGRKIMDCRSLTSKGREGRQASPTGSGSSAPKKIRFYALQTHHDQEGSPDAVTGILKVFHLDVYDFLDPGATLCFVKPYVVMRFDVLPNVLL
ncbi:hypothetical protein MTR67_017560 [Solanum verrucosum]|uniref:Gag-pol polyprotein n=1 Tax=Solanum verrucosum TaxID=315347 RepID=A0AAF0TSB8_SOLVR|nr:hypothetical protein MTR67_017560 [Solanum verrucosum]